MQNCKSNANMGAVFWGVPCLGWVLYEDLTEMGTGGEGVVRRWGLAEREWSVAEREWSVMSRHAGYIGCR